MKRIKFYIEQIFRLLLSIKKQEELVWKDLKNFHSKSKWKYGIYESDKYIESIFEIGNDQGAIFYYMIYDQYFHCRVKVLENYPIDLTTDLFVLATHFNNLLNNGVVKVNVNGNYIEYHQKRDLLIPLLYSGEIHSQITSHFNTSKDIYLAFQRLVIENDPPALIIADLLNSNERRDQENE